MPKSKDPYNPVPHLTIYTTVIAMPVILYAISALQAQYANHAIADITFTLIFVIQPHVQQVLIYPISSAEYAHNVLPIVLRVRVPSVVRLVKAAIIFMPICAIPLVPPFHI